MTGRWRVWLWMALIAAALAIVVTVVVVVTGKAASEQFTLRMRPTPPLTMTECIAAATSHGYGPDGASGICSVGRGRRWYQQPTDLTHLLPVRAGRTCLIGEHDSDCRRRGFMPGVPEPESAR